MIYVVRYALVVLYTAFWASVACLEALIGRGGEGGVRAGRNWARWILGSSRIRVEIEGLENPTAEVLAQWIWQRLSPRLAGLSRIEIQETCTSGCTYEGD